MLELFFSAFIQSARSFICVPITTLCLLELFEPTTLLQYIRFHTFMTCVYHCCQFGTMLCWNYHEFVTSSTRTEKNCTNTVVKVGVPTLENDLFTNVNKLCPSCDTSSAQAWKLLGNVHVPKPVPNLCTACVQAWTRLVHWSYCLTTPCTLHWYCLATPCACPVQQVWALLVY